MSPDAKRIGERIKSLRIARGLSQSALAKEIKKPRETVSSWEAGRYSPSLRSRVLLATFFKVGIEYISCDGDQRLAELREMALTHTKKALDGEEPPSVVVRNAANLGARGAPDAEKSASAREEEIRQLMKGAHERVLRKLARLKEELGSG